MNKIFVINKKDNVAVALTELQKGETLQNGNSSISVLEDVPKGHKIALYDIPQGAGVIKYGYPIGRAKKNILRGEWIHSHNMKTGLDVSSGVYTYEKSPKDEVSVKKPSTFLGYRRSNGDVGTRNDLWIIPTVGCVNEIGERISQKFQNETKQIYAEDVKVLKHPYGCSQLGDDLSSTRQILANFVNNPNAGGVLVLSLGCENNTLPEFKEAMGQYDESRVRFLRAQDAGNEIDDGVKLLNELNDNMRGDRREQFPFSKLRVGVKCGGSDGFSGITANPLIGMFTDYLTDQGGTVVQTEVPEMFGAETTLMNRARDEAVFNKVVRLIKNFKQYYAENGQPVYENPSPGNKAGGITTLEEKSLGCVQKSGTSEVEDVLDYTQKINRSGLNLLCAPGNDLVSATALASSGCNMILFSTGRGTPYGTVVPTVKVSTNTQLYREKPKWIDFNAGKLIDGGEKEELLEKFIGMVQNVASGKPVCSELNHFSMISIWKNGVTL